MPSFANLPSRSAPIHAVAPIPQQQAAPLSISSSIRNRRRRYLSLHPGYLTLPSHELADPLNYDRLVRRHQSPAQREAEGKRKGFSGTLEADLLRAEARRDEAIANAQGDLSAERERDIEDRIVELQNQAKDARASNENGVTGGKGNEDSSMATDENHSSVERKGNTQADLISEDHETTIGSVPVPPSRYPRATARPKPLSDFDILTLESGSLFPIDSPSNAKKPTSAEASQLWQSLIAQRFLRGDDPDFDYTTVDESEEYDDGAEREMQREEEERWILDENESEAEHSGADVDEMVDAGNDAGKEIGAAGDERGVEERRRTQRREKTGETGIQDF